ncbi:DUF3299 domain-containing protein [Ohtaekwangia sp.]|uniref:DUF3299 domain-containing protein n=1 Tax=Ohtaekwangia sp. TaxID=2066019 RepID=UPI002F95CF14
MRSTFSRILLAIFLFILASSVNAQKKMAYKGFPSLVWPKLYNITFVKTQDRLGEVDKPVFTDAVKALNGKQITLPGYMVPFENGMKGNHFMLSSLPLNACFFCGVGGPETVVEVFSTKPIAYTEKPIEIQGKLMLNDRNPDQMIYIVENAEVLGEAGL